MQGLTALAVGPYHACAGNAVMNHHDLQSLTVFTSLQKLTLTGVMGLPDNNMRLLLLWEVLAT